MGDMKVTIGSSSWSYSYFDNSVIYIGNNNQFQGCADTCDYGKTYSRDEANGGGTIDLIGNDSMGQEWIYVAYTYDDIQLQVHGYSGGYSQGTVTVWWDCDS